MTISVRRAGRFSFFFNVDQISRGNGKISRRWEIYVRQDIYVSGYRGVVVGCFCCCCCYLFILHLLPSWKYFIAYTQRVTLDNVHTLYIYAMKIVFCSLSLYCRDLPYLLFLISHGDIVTASPFHIPCLLLLEFNQAFCIFILCFCFHSPRVYINIVNTFIYDRTLECRCYLKRERDKKEVGYCISWFKVNKSFMFKGAYSWCSHTYE